MTAQHWPQVEAIYAEGSAGGGATFESAPPDHAGFDAGWPESTSDHPG